MSALAQLRDRGLHLSAKDGALTVRPREALTDDLRQVIRTNKDAILRDLAEESARSTKCQRQERIDVATRMLHQVPSRNRAFVAGEETGDGIPVTVVIRTAHGMITCELTIAKEHWSPTLFLQFLQQQDDGLPA